MTRDDKRRQEMTRDDKVDLERETDDVVLNRREKQISLGKGTEHYRKYTAGCSFICCFLRTRDKHGKFPVSKIYVFGMT